MHKTVFSLEGIPGCDLELAKKMINEFHVAVVGELSEAFDLVQYVAEEDKLRKKPEILDINNIVQPMSAIFIEQKDLNKRILIADEHYHECEDLDLMGEALEKYGVAVVSNIAQAEVLFKRIKMFDNPEWRKYNISIKISVARLWMYVNAGGALTM
jgi:hypothetical protein